MQNLEEVKIISLPTADPVGELGAHSLRALGAAVQLGSPSRVSGKSSVLSTTPPVYPGPQQDSFACLEKHLLLLVRAAKTAPNAPKKRTS